VAEPYGQVNGLQKCGEAACCAPRSGSNGGTHGRIGLAAGCKGGSGQLTRCLTLWRSFAASLIEAGYDIRAIHELLGHWEMSATIMYASMLRRGGEEAYSRMARL
jgi:integrase